jgi:predicted RNA-binding protein YlqC (UPF0109 family)
MQAFLEFVVSGLVNHPESVSVTPVDQGGATLYELRMNPDDVGKVIGRGGMTISAIRALTHVGAAKKGRRCAVEIVEERPRRSDR